MLGVLSDRAERTLREVYATTIEAGTPVVVTDFATAELVKVSANAFLATKISFINAIAEVCEVTGADVVDLADSLGYDDRIGRKFLNAGVGFGGGCLPKDMRAFVHRAGELGAEGAMSLLSQVDDINQGRREHAVQVATSMLGGHVAGARVAVWGAAFKPQTDDVRDSPALWIAGQLHLRGADVSVYDPKANDTARGMFPTLTYADRRGLLRPRRGPAAAPHGLAGVRRGRPGEAHQRGPQPAAPRRRQLPRLRRLAGRRLDRARPRPPLREAQNS